jgi:small subunit ribosomal protein S8
MSMTDPIADMLTRVRNAVMAGHREVTMPTSNIKAEIAAVMRSEGFIRGFKIVRGEVQNELRLFLKYRGSTPAVKGIRRISRPGLRKYTAVDKMPEVLNGLGAAILSTNQGIMTDTEARERNVGGEILCYIW